MSLYKEQESLTAEQSQLDSELSELQAALQVQLQRKSQLQTLDAALQIKENQLRAESANTSFSAQSVHSDTDRAQELKNKAAELAHENDAKERGIEAEERKGKELRTEVDSMETALKEKQRSVDELCEKLRSASQRVAALESRKFDLQLDLETAASAQESAAASVAAIEKEVETLQNDLSAPLVQYQSHADSTIESLEKLIKEEESRQLKLQSDLLDVKTTTGKSASTRKNTQGKILELTQLLSKVQSSILLTTRSIEESAAVLQKLTDQQAIVEGKEKYALQRKTAAEARKAEVESALMSVEGQCDALQMQLSDCLRRESAVAEGKRRQWQALQDLRAEKDAQTEEFQRLKQLKRDLMIEEIKLEDLQATVAQLRGKVASLHSESCEEADPDSLLQRVNSEDEAWQRAFRAEQEKLRERAETLKEREAALRTRDS